MLEESNNESSSEPGHGVDIHDVLVLTPASSTETVPVNATEVDEAARPSKAKAVDVISLTDQTNLLPSRKVIAVFCGLSLGSLVSTLDSTIVASTLPTISDTFNAGAVVSWVPSGYLLTSTAFQPLCEYSRSRRVYDRFADSVNDKPQQMGASATYSVVRQAYV